MSGEDHSAGRTRPALSGLTLTIAPGQLVIITGSSGAGKTSLLSLLLRFAEPTAGAIELTGPGLMPLDQWWGSSEATTADSGLSCYCGVAVKR